jgi:hypothetical protein
MSGVATSLGVASLGVAVPLIGAAEAEISATAVLAQPEITGKLAGALKVGVALSVSAPTASIQAELDAVVAVAAKIQAKINAGITAPSASLAVAGNAALIASLQVKLAALSLSLDYALGLGELAAAAGVAAYAYEGTCDSMGTGLGNVTAAGIPGGAPTDQVHALLLVTSASATWSAMQTVFKTS